jgi:hypothetical protein
MNVLSIVLGPIAEIAKDYMQGRREAKAQKAQVDQALQEKRLEIISKSEDYAQAFRLAQVQNAGWRPGYWTVTLSIPVVMAFVPKLSPYVLEGFRVLEQTPDYFQYFLGIAVTSAFGYQVADKAYEWWKAP